MFIVDVCHILLDQVVLSASEDRLDDIKWPHTGGKDSEQETGHILKPFEFGITKVDLMKIA